MYIQKFITNLSSNIPIHFQSYLQQNICCALQQLKIELNTLVIRNSLCVFLGKCIPLLLPGNLSGSGLLLGFHFFGCLRCSFWRGYFSGHECARVVTSSWIIEDQPLVFVSPMAVFYLVYNLTHRISIWCNALFWTYNWCLKLLGYLQWKLRRW